MKFTEFKNLTLLSPSVKPITADNPDLDVTVAPGTDVVYLLKKTGEGSSYKCQFYPRVVYQARIGPDEMRKVGKKSQVEETDAESGMVMELQQYTYIH